MLKEEYNIQKEPFKFEYTEPTSDWYITKKVEIQFDEYNYFELQWRVGKDCWLIGYKYDKNLRKCVSKELGRISPCDIIEFIKWCKIDEYGGSSLICKISSIDTSIDLPHCLMKLFMEMENNK